MITSDYETLQSFGAPKENHDIMILAPKKN